MPHIDKPVFNAGLSGFGGSGLDLSSLMTTADLTLDVNQATGSDTTGDGTPSKPFATIMKAVASVPPFRLHLITIRVFAGTYAETIKDGGVYLDRGTFAGRLIVQGQDFTTPVLGSGSITSGTLGTAPATGITRTVAGAAWTVNELKGYMARITSGSLSGRYYPIAANAAATIDIPDISASLNGATFDIVQHAVTITNGGGGSFASAVIGNSGPANGNTAFYFQRVKIAPSNFYGVYVGNGTAQVLECLVDTHTFAGLFTANHSSQLVCSRSYIKNAAGVTAGIVCNESFEIFAGGTVIDGGQRGLQATSILRFAPVLTGSLIVQNATIIGMEFRSGPTISDSFSTGRILVRGCAVGVVVQSNARFLAQFWEVVNNTSHGIQVVPNSYLTGFNSFNMFSSKIQGNGGDGIRVESPHNHVMFGGAGADISGNTGYGLRFGGQPAGYAPASHNSAMFDSNVTMSSNTAGDITHDNGVTTKTLAQVRTDGFEADANLFNRVTAV